MSAQGLGGAGRRGGRSGAGAARTGNIARALSRPRRGGRAVIGWGGRVSPDRPGRRVPRGALKGLGVLLAVDSGNTNAVFAVYRDDELHASWRISTNPRRTADEYAIWLTQLLSLAWLKPADIDAAIIGNVVPDAMFNLLSLSRHCLHCQPLVIGGPNCEVPIGR